MIYLPIFRESNGSLFGSGCSERANVGERAIGRREVCPARVSLLPNGETGECSTADQSSQGHLSIYLYIYLSDRYDFLADKIDLFDRYSHPFFKWMAVKFSQFADNSET